MADRAEVDGQLSITVAGTVTPLEFLPHRLFAAGLISEGEARETVVEFANDSLVSLELPWAAIQVIDDRVRLKEIAPDRYESCIDLIQGLAVRQPEHKHSKAGIEHIKSITFLRSGRFVADNDSPAGTALFDFWCAGRPRAFESLGATSLDSIRIELPKTLSCEKATVVVERSSREDARLFIGCLMRWSREPDGPSPLIAAQEEWVEGLILADKIRRSLADEILVHTSSRQESSGVDR